MDKKDVYEHLANIYLDASQKKRKKRKKRFNIKNISIIAAAFFLGAGVFVFSLLQKTKPLFSETALVLVTDAVKINFNFDPAKKETFSIDLNKLDITRYKTLGVTVKKANFQDAISLKVEFINAFKEKSEIYLKDIPYRWQEYKIPLQDFKNISDWSDMRDLIFAVEEWNTKENQGIVYIDNIRLIK